MRSAMIPLAHMHSPDIRHLVNVSGGADSTATILYARECGVPFQAVFAGTGNEHPLVYEYLDYLEHALDIKIIRVRADFTQRIARKRRFIARDRRPRRRKFKGIWKPCRWTNKDKRRVLAHLHPTGIPFLDLCAWKGRFPSIGAAFCTQKLKREPIYEQVQRPLLKAGFEVWSWQGVRRDESQARRNAAEFEPDRACRDGRLFSVRPLVDWSKLDVFAMHRRHGIKPNPLYAMGFNRVGCMPCVNCRKDELFLMAKLCPEVIDRVREWERHVGLCSKRAVSTFFHSSLFSGVGDTRARIDNAVRWAKTTPGGRQFSMLKALEMVEMESVA